MMLPLHLSSFPYMYDDTKENVYMYSITVQCIIYVDIS